MMPNPDALAPDFYARDTIDVARDLLGATLVRIIDGTRLSGTIVETEAYCGAEDRASHASRGASGRARIMYGPPGVAYVYLIYGMHNCLNAVTEAAGTAGAVLIRAIEPQQPSLARTDGPGRLCRALAIDRSLNGAPLDGPDLWIEPAATPPDSICQGRRVGVDYAGDWADREWRFWIDGNRWVSARATARAPL